MPPPASLTLLSGIVSESESSLFNLLSVMVFYNSKKVINVKGYGNEIMRA